jgi:PAS domain S-box-containing protein
MGWTTILLTAVASVCLTLAAIHLTIWWKRRTTLANLGFSVLAVGVAAFSVTSLMMTRAETLPQYEAALRWTHVPVFIMVLGVSLFMWFYFHTARPWLVHTTWLLRLAALGIHFSQPGTLNYERLTSLHRIELLGERVSAVEGVRGAWQWLDSVSLLLVVWLIIDTSVRAWRSGTSHEKHSALVIGGTTAAFVMLGTLYSGLIFVAGLPLPHVEGLFFVGVIGAMSQQLGADVLRAAQLAGELEASEAALRESDRRMTMAAEAARLGMWIWDIPTGDIWMSDTCREILGFPAGAAVDYRAFLERLHPDDQEAREAAIREALITGRPYRADFRILRPDGSRRWVASHGRIEQDGSGTPLRMLGVAVDISDQRQAELAARELSGRFINAQEIERRRIARDLHDDLNQRLALISVQLELLGRGQSSEEFQIKAEGLAAQIRDLSKEVHKLSYQLHPAKLDQLGLVTAARSWCRDLAQAGLQVEFHAADVPNDLLPDTALCAYRVIQEALRNVVRHSGTDRARVELTGAPDGLRLVVSDAGGGFDPAAASLSAGLGLISMQERVRLLHGTIAVQSTPGAGTTVTATIPLAPESPVRAAREDLDGAAV